FVIVCPASAAVGCTAIENEREAPAASVPTLQETVVAVDVQSPGRLVIVSPGGSGSVIATPVASPEPVLVGAIAKVTSWPTLTVVALAVLVATRSGWSAAPAGGGGSVAGDGGGGGGGLTGTWLVTPTAASAWLSVESGSVVAEVAEAVFVTVW